MIPCPSCNGTGTARGFMCGITGVYHHVGSQYLAQYLAEFDHRFNTRKGTDGARTVAGLRKIEGKRLMLRAPARAASTP